MGIIDKANKIIKDTARHPWFDHILWMFIIMFVGVGSFLLGILYERDEQQRETPIQVEYSREALELWYQYQDIKESNQLYFASKNGQVVYPVGCSRGNTIKEENKIFFENLDQAFNLGYREATGC